MKMSFCFPLTQVAGKRVPEEELQAQQWIEQIIGERFPNAPYEYALRDGIILCKLMNRLAPGIIQKINTSGGDYKLMDNINQWVHGTIIFKHFLHFDSIENDDQWHFNALPLHRHCLWTRGFLQRPVTKWLHVPSIVVRCTVIVCAI